MNRIIINKIDLLLAKLGIFLGFLIASLYIQSSTIHLLSNGSILVLSGLIYILIQRYTSTIDHRFIIDNNKKTILDVVYLMLFSFLLIFSHNYNQYKIIIYLVYSFCVGATAISILFSNNKVDYLKQIIKILLLSFYMKLLIFSYAGFLPGIDPWMHAKMNILLSQSGTIDVLFDKEKYFPIMHIQTATASIICGINIKDASNLAILIPFILTSSFVYLLGRDLFGEQIGLFALLLINVSDYHIYWGSAIQTTSYGVMIYFVIIYLIYKSYFIKKIDVRSIEILILLILTLIITHAISAFIFLVSIFSLFLSRIIYKLLIIKLTISRISEAHYRNHFHRTDFPIRNLFLLSMMILLQHWFIALYSKDNPFFDQIISSLNYYITGQAGFLNRIESVATYSMMAPPLLEQLAEVFGFSQLLFFIVLGSLFILSKKHRSDAHFSVFFVLLILFFITYMFPLFGLRNIIPTRWFIFEYFLGSILAAFSIFEISTRLEYNYTRFLFILLVYISISFFMSSNSISNEGSPLWMKNSTISWYYTIAEVKGAETISRYSDEIFSDNGFSTSVINIYLNKSRLILKDSKEQIFNQNNKIFLWRTYMVNRPIQSFTKLLGYEKDIEYPSILGQETLTKLNGMDKIYENTEIKAFYIRSHISH